MNKVVAAFLDRLAERFTALVAGLLSSRVEGLHAVVQAEQQSQLEDLARKYEADGKPEIAQTLRERALRLTSTNLASEGLQVMQQVTEPPASLPAPSPESTAPNSDVRGLPSFDTAKAHKRRRRVESKNDATFPTLEASL